MRNAAAILVMALAGCSLLGPSRDETPTYHALVLPAARNAASPRPDGPTLLVGVPRAGPGFDSPRMAYRTEPFVIAYFARHQWVDTPARMLAPLFVHAIEETGRFHAVVQAPTSIATSLRLDTEIVRLIQDFSATPSRLHLTIRAQVVDTKERRVLAEREISSVEAAASDDPEGGVAAANRAMQATVRALGELCAGAVPGG